MKLWQIVCGLEKKNQAIVLLLNLPKSNASDIKVKIFNKIEEELNTDNRVKRYLEVMAGAFKLSEQATIYKVFLDFIINMKKKPDETMMECVTRYNKMMNIAKKKQLTMSSAMMGLKLIHDAGISETDRKLVLTEIDFTQLDTVREGKGWPKQVPE